MWKAFTLAGLAACVSLALARAGPGSASDLPQPAALTLLGTAGGPGGYATRAGIASLITVRGKAYLIDAGEGVSHQLARTGADGRDIHVVFFTHLHDDHTSGLPGLASFFYTMGGQRMELVGPPGTNGLLAALLAWLQPNTAIRTAEHHLNEPPSAHFTALEAKPGVIYSDDAVTVSAVENSHYVLSAAALGEAQKSYSLKVQTPDKVIVFTGDTGPSEAVEAFARGADILVAEMMTGSSPPNVPPQVQAHMLHEHLSPTEVGKMAARANVKTLVLSHVQEVAPEDVAEIRRQYSGPVIVGQDLMTIPLQR